MSIQSDAKRLSLSGQRFLLEGRCQSYESLFEIDYVRLRDLSILRFTGDYRSVVADVLASSVGGSTQTRCDTRSSVESLPNLVGIVRKTMTQTNTTSAPSHAPLFSML